jgi:threonine/homoserine/homoserine lactone efflux protein
MDEHALLSGSVVTLVLEAAVVMGTPGPSTIAVMAAGAAFGVRRSLGFASGAVAGSVVVLLAVAIGVVAILLSVPALGFALSVAGAIYVLYLAFRIATAPPLSERVTGAPAPAFAAGLGLAVANPKAWFAIAAVFAGTNLAGLSSALDALSKTMVLAVMIAVIHIGWLLAGVSVAGFLRDPRRSRIANGLFGLILAATAMLALVR